MKANIKFYLFYAAIFLIGASISAGLYFAYGACLFPTDVFDVSDSFKIGELIDCMALVLKPVTFIFLSAFTIYACAVSSAVCLYVGAIFGRFTISYCISEHIAFTHAASLIILVSFGAVTVIMSKEATICRNSLKSTAPDPSQIIKTAPSISLFSSYLSSCIAVIAVTLGAYMMRMYFQL